MRAWIVVLLWDRRVQYGLLLVLSLLLFASCSGGRGGKRLWEFGD